MRNFLTATALISLAFLGACNQVSDPEADPSSDGNEAPPSSEVPRNLQTGETLNKFTLTEEGMAYLGLVGAGADTTTSTEQLNVDPGTTTSVRSKNGEVDLRFGPNSLIRTTTVVLSVDYSGGELSFDFGPDGTQFDPSDKVLLRFFPHVVDPSRFHDWTRFNLYWERYPGWYEPLPTLHSMESWTDPISGVTTSEYCLSTYLDHFSKYAALR